MPRCYPTLSLVVSDAASALGVAVLAGSLALAAGAAPARAAAPEVKTLGTFSRPKKKDGAVAKRGDAYMLVTQRPKLKKLDVISINPGYTFKKGSVVAITIGKADFSLFTDGGAAWARDDGTDRKIVAAMLKGAMLTAKGTAEGGGATTDMFSLEGIGQAYGAINQACGVKP